MADAKVSSPYLGVPALTALCVLGAPSDPGKILSCVSPAISYALDHPRELRGHHGEATSKTGSGAYK
jgi:hypothetical protein